MELFFEIINGDHTTADMPANYTFKHTGGVIGRGAQADWCLPDPKRQISSVHAVISFENEGFYLTDKSTNGTYLGSHDASLNKNEPYPVSQGDVFEIGSIAIRASIKQDPSAYHSQHQDSFHSQNDNIDGLIPDDSFLSDDPLYDLLISDDELSQARQASQPVHSTREQTSPPLQEQMISPAFDTSTDDGHDDMFATDFSEFGGINAATLNNTPPQDSHTADPASSVNKPPHSSQSAESEPAAKQSPDNNPHADQLAIQALAKGLGIPIEHIQDSNQLAYDVGILLRTAVTGIQQLLRTRAELKNSLTSQATRIQAQGNNPLKFSHDSNEALHILLTHKPGYLQGIEAIRQSCRDVQAHQLALNDACHNTLDALIDKLSPQALVYRFVQDGVKAPLGLGSGAGQYWQSYVRLHEQIVSDKEWRNAILEKDFGQHYETQLQLLNAALRV